MRMFIGQYSTSPVNICALSDCGVALVSVVVLLRCRVKRPVPPRQSVSDTARRATPSVAVVCTGGALCELSYGTICNSDNYYGCYVVTSLEEWRANIDIMPSRKPSQSAYRHATPPN